ncbi:DUF1010 domain-containing protein [Delftia tsuruhatensis]
MARNKRNSLARYLCTLPNYSVKPTRLRRAAYLAR